MMRLKRIIPVLLWSAALLFLCVGALMLDNAVFFGAAAILLLLSPGTLLLQLPLRKMLNVKLTAADAAEKGQTQEANLWIENGSRFLFSGGVCAAVSIRNLLTGEETKRFVNAGAFPGRTERKTFCYGAERCGVLLLQAKDIRVYDWLGVFSVKTACKAQAKTTVLPDTFPVELIADPSSGAAESGGEYLQNIPGADMTELFGLREYAPGDPLRAVHWKLSAKTDGLLIRIGSMPQENEILLLWDRSGGAADPAVRDALAECISSVGQALLAGGVRFSVGRMENGECFPEPAYNENAFLNALNVLLGAPDRVEGCPPQVLSDSGRFSSALVFTESSCVSFSLANGSTTVLRCAPDGDITPDGYETQLQRLII